MLKTSLSEEATLTASSEVETIVSQAVISILSGPRFVQRGPTYRSSRSGRRDETDAVGSQAQPAEEDGTGKGHLDRRAIEP